MLKDPKINFWCKFLVKKNYYICFVCLFVCMFHFHYHSEKIFALISLQNQKAWWWKQLFRQKILDWKVQNLKKQSNYISLARHRGLVERQKTHDWDVVGSNPTVEAFFYAPLICILPWKQKFSGNKPGIYAVIPQMGGWKLSIIAMDEMKAC